MSRVVCFHGADHKCGVTMLTQCVAERISQLEPSLKVLLVHSEGRGGTDYSPMVSESMENIKPYLSGKLLDPAELLGRARWRGNLFVIGGAGETGSIFSYHPDMGKYMIESLRGSVDVIICDTGSEIEHGLSLGTLLAADSIYMVMTQQESAVSALENKHLLYEKLGIDAGALIVNKHDKGSPYTVKYLAERLGVPAGKFRTVRRSDYGIQAETDARPLVSYSGSAFRKDIDAVAREVTAIGTL